MILLEVWLRAEDASPARHIGTLACSDPDAHGRFSSEFRYADRWLADPSAYPIDPVSLPLRAVSYTAQNLHPPLAVFDDSLPDDWGRALLVREHRLPRARQGAPHLLAAIGANALGALVFGGEEFPQIQDRTADILDLPDLLEAARRWEAGQPIAESRLVRLLAAASSPGGARPKALIREREGRKTGRRTIHWIAKFPSRQRDAGMDVVGLEATCMRLARDAKLEVPDTRIVDVGRRRALLVRRFDVPPAGGRRHMLSLRTLALERPGAYVLSYSELAETVRKVSDAPGADVAALFRQMVFNAVIGNTDDHLKNFWMIHDRTGYRLSPAFDLVPDVARRTEHALAFEYAHRAPDGRTLLAIAKRWGVRNAGTIVAEVLRAGRRFSSIARELRVADASIRMIEADVAARVETIALGS